MVERLRRLQQAGRQNEVEQYEQTIKEQPPVLKNQKRQVEQKQAKSVPASNRMDDRELFQRITEQKIDSKFCDKKFDPIAAVVDTLLSTTPLKQQFNQLQQQNQFLDGSIRLLATEKATKFNKMLYSYQPIQEQLTEAQTHIVELKDAANLLQDEIKSCQVAPLLRMENTIEYYDEMIRGLQVFQTIQQSLADVEFLTEQQNFREASIELQKICKMLRESEVEDLLLICNIDQEIQRQLQQKRRLLRDAIVQNMLDFLFLRRANTMLFQQRLLPIHTLVTQFMSSKFEQESIRQEKCIQSLQSVMTQVARKTADQTYQTRKLLKEQEENPTEVVQTALTSLQKQPNEAITKFNIAYLVLLADSYKRTTQSGLAPDSVDDPIELSFSAYLLPIVDQEMRELFTRVVSQLSDLPRPVLQEKQCSIMKDLMKLSFKMHFKGQALFLSIFYFMVSISTSFQVIDNVLDTTTSTTNIQSEGAEDQSSEKKSCFKQFYNRFLYNLTSILLVLFDNQATAIEHNNRLGAVMSGSVYERRDSEIIGPKKLLEQKQSFKTSQKQSESRAPANETEKQKKERRRKLEEEQKINFKDILEVQMSGGYNNERPAVFIFDFIQVFCLSPVLQQSLKGLMQEISPEARKYLPPLEIIRQYNNDTTRMIRTNYEFMISAWSDRLVNKIMAKHCTDIIEIDANQRSTGNSLLGLEMKIKTDLFLFVLRFSEMLKVIVFNIPLGFVNEDKIYKQERHDDLYDCTIKILKKVIQTLTYQIYKGSLTSTQQLIFNQTHSGEGYMFSNNVYALIKGERHYPILFGGKSTSMGETDVISYLSYFSFDPEEKQIMLEKLRTRMSVGELVVSLLTNVQALGEHFRQCTAQLDATTDAGLTEQFSQLMFNLNDYQANLLIWIRMELAGRIYSCMRDLSRVDFATGSFSNKRKESLKAEPSIQTMLQEVKQIYNLLAIELLPLHSYWLMTQSYHLSLNLFLKAMLHLRVMVVDERGLYRLKQSLSMIKEEFVRLIQQSELKLTSSTISRELMERNGQLLAKIQYILEMLGTKTIDLKEKIGEYRDIGLTREEIKLYLSISTDAHECVTDEGQLLKLF